eukprot:Lithocolla_globosa_v1_NODE_2035_length_2198_cov_21.818479.p3 type:complete len:143 gc:universal NODE_2035_length_2198_cov_21.818479:1073-645(-)
MDTGDEGENRGHQIRKVFLCHLHLRRQFVVEKDAQRPLNQLNQHRQGVDDDRGVERVILFQHILHDLLNHFRALQLFDERVAELGGMSHVHDIDQGLGRVLVDDGVVVVCKKFGEPGNQILFIEPLHNRIGVFHLLSANNLQ